MAATNLKLFPLEVVLLPGTPMPLHIFEDRYKDLIRECRQKSTEFGIVQARDGGVLNIGCSAVVERVLREYEDGRMDIIVLGRRRFEIDQVDNSEACLQAEVTFFDDEGDGQGPAPVQLRAMALAGLNALVEAEGKSAPSIVHDDPQLSFKVAWFVEDLDLRQTLLTLRSETERLRMIVAALPEHAARARRKGHVQRVAPRNGHGMIH